MTLHATILTLFPEMFPGPLGYSLIGRALEDGKWSLDCINIRDFGRGKHKDVDGTPAGGGAGMVMRADVLGDAIDAAFAKTPDAQLIYMSPKGERFSQEMAASITAKSRRKPPAQFIGSEPEGSGHKNLAEIIVLCGRFEGIDERIIEKYQPLEISLGDFVMTGGELAAMAMLDACVRLLPDVIGEQESLEQESFGLSQDYACLLEHPHYTKPPSWDGFSIPEVLLSGHHGQIDRWRKEKAKEITKARRPDLLAAPKDK